MLKWFSGLIDSNEKVIKRLQPDVDEINALEPDFAKLTADELKAKTTEFREYLAKTAAEARQKLAGARQELDETRQKLTNAPNELEREDLSAQSKHLEDEIIRLEKERHQVEEAALNELLPEAFAAVREAAKRTIGQRHFDVQLMGGIVLHQGKIAEMKTGEGKTLVATLPLYLNALTSEGCHLVTVNDYLSKRDHLWMGPIYHALGINIASIQHEASVVYDPTYESSDPKWPYLRPVDRRKAYEADITYGTNNEFGFDYLRDNMVGDLALCVQRPLNYAIVDEVDNILIDEARTPLIISGPAEEAEQKYQTFARLVPRLRPETDYKIDEKTRTVSLTDTGISNMENMLRRDGLLKAPNLYDAANYSLTRYLDSALKAHALFKRDRDYMVKDGEVIIVDEFTGRLMLGRRYSEGLHQAIEAKERVKVQRESITYATITFQNYFRMYKKLAGMTGTAATEAEEFHKIYKLEVVVVPTNKPMVRQDSPDRIYKNEKAKFQAVAQEIAELHQQKCPVLIGTVSIEKSEMLSEVLKKRGIAHQVLNAKYHEREAGIIAQAGEPGAVTVATNMAGRGVDIVLGGKEPEKLAAEDEAALKEWEKAHDAWQKKHEEVVGLGGLHILGTERHEARRIDNQLRGRAGRQGDPGSTRFYVSLEDDIMKRFGGDRVKGIMNLVGMGEDTPIENRMIDRSIESAQVRVEGYHFDMRKHLIDYDDVINQQRKLIYSERKKILSGADLKANIMAMVKKELHNIVVAHAGGEQHDGWDTAGVITEADTIFLLPPELKNDGLATLKPEQVEEKLVELAEDTYEQREKEVGPENMRLLERVVMLRIIDSLWIEHLTMMEDMRQSIGLQAVAQRDPLVAYKREGGEAFQNLLDTIQHDVAHTIYHVGLVTQPARQQAPPPPSPMAKVAARSEGNRPKEKVAGKKVGRNDPCPCGSGKKYKHCCGK
ncbi:MAG: preprotein translocase subunit SecA [Chloroflexota bacterium]